MSDQDIKQVSTLTGTFVALKPAPERVQAGNARPESGKEVPDKEQPDMQLLARKLNAANFAIGRDLRFKVDMQSGRSVIQVLDRETGDIIREVPPEQARTYVSGIGDVALRLFDGEI